MNRKLTVFLLAFGTACAEGPFSPHRPDNLESDIESLFGRLGATAPRPDNAAGIPLIATVSPAPNVALTVYDLRAEKVVFKVPADIRSRVVVAGVALVAREGERELVGRDARTGAVRWRHKLVGEGTFMGAASDGSGVYYVTEETGPRRVGNKVSTLVGLNAESGSHRFTIGAISRLGAPAARGGLVMVPMGYQWVAVLDGVTGDELARIRNKEEAITFVVAAPEGVFFGSRGVFRLDRKSASGLRAQSTYFRAELPSDQLRLLYHFDAYNAAQASYTAYDRNRLLWVPRADGQAGFLGNVVLASFRFFFGMNPQTGKLNWAASLPRADVVASQHTGNYIVTVTSDGDVVALHANSGAESMRAKLPSRVAGATVDARGFAPTRNPAHPLDLREALLGIIWDPDRRFEAIKLFALEELGRIEGGSITEDLVKALTYEKIDRRVYEKAGEAMLQRVSATDAELLVKTLKVNTDYVQGTRARGIDVLARAVGKLKLNQAVLPLLAHLEDPETPPVALREVVRALDDIGSSAALGSFRQFLLTYRVDPDLANEPEVLRRMCDALLRLGVQHDRQLIRFVAEDPQTQPYLRAYAAERLKPSNATAKN